MQSLVTSGVAAVIFMFELSSLLTSSCSRGWPNAHYYQIFHNFQFGCFKKKNQILELDPFEKEINVSKGNDIICEDIKLEENFPGTYAFIHIEGDIKGYKISSYKRVQILGSSFATLFFVIFPGIYRFLPRFTGLIWKRFDQPSEIRYLKPLCRAFTEEN